MNSLFKPLLRTCAPVLSILSQQPAPFLLQQSRNMSKYLSKQAAKRLPLNSKRGNKNYYKGKGGTKEGRHTSKGRYIIDPLKRLELVVPDLTGFKLKPYIAHTANKYSPEKRIGPTP